MFWWWFGLNWFIGGFLGVIALDELEKERYEAARVARHRYYAAKNPNAWWAK